RARSPDPLASPRYERRPGRAVREAPFEARRALAPVRLLATHDLHDVGLERGIAVRVEANAAAGAVQVGRRDGCADFVGIETAGPPDGVDGDERRIVGLGVDVVGVLSVLRPDLFDELARDG